MIQYLNIQGKQTPVSYSTAALRYWEHKIEKPIDELMGRLSDPNNPIDSYEMSWLCYSGLKHGHEESTNRPFKTSFNDFCNSWGKDDVIMAELAMAFFQEISILMEEKGADTSALKKTLKEVKEGLMADAQEKKLSTSGDSIEHAQVA